MKIISKFFENPVTYKIITDILTLLIIIAFGVLTAETIIPGIVSIYISPLDMFFIISLLVFLIYITSSKQNISIPLEKNSKKVFFVFSIFVFILFIVIASFRYGLILGIPIIILAIITYILLYKSLQEIINQD